MLVLAIGDLFIPYRQIDLPQKFKTLLVPGKIHQILCTGNLCSQDVLDSLRGLCPQLVTLTGAFDSHSQSQQALDASTGSGSKSGSVRLAWRGDIEGVRVGLVHALTHPSLLPQVVPTGQNVACC